MTINRKVLHIILAMLIGLGIFGRSLYQDYQATQALEENTEYQVVKTIEAQYPEVYVVAVKAEQDSAFVYFILPDGEREESYYEGLLIDLVTALYNAYPAAKTYHILPTEIQDVATFEGAGHLGVATMGYGFTNFAAEILATTECPPCSMDALFEAGEFGVYQANQAGLHLIQKPTDREPGHIPPWESVEE